MAEETQDPGPAVAFRRGGDLWVAIVLDRKHWWQFWRPSVVQVRLTTREGVRLYQTMHRAITQLGLQLEDGE